MCIRDSLKHVVDACLAAIRSDPANPHNAAVIETGLSILANAAHFGCIDLLITSGASLLYAQLLANASDAFASGDADYDATHSAQARVVAALSNLTAVPEGCHAFTSEERQMLVVELDKLLERRAGSGLERFTPGFMRGRSGKSVGERGITSIGKQSVRASGRRSSITASLFGGDDDLTEIRARAVKQQAEIALFRAAQLTGAALITRALLALGGS